MTRFRFRLESALRWRTTQLELEERQLDRSLAEAARRAAALAETRAEQERAGRIVFEKSTFTAAELAASANWRAALDNRARNAIAECAAAERQVDAQRARVLEARRCVRLLERLKERRLAEWNAAVQRELDEFAGDMHRGRHYGSAPSLPGT